MVRIRTTTSLGKIFLSPFVFTQEKAEKLITKISEWHSTPTYEIIKVESWPKMAEYSEDDIVSGNIYDKALAAEHSWRKYQN